MAHPFEDSDRQQAVREARKRVSHIVYSPEVQEFCIGVTDDPSSVKERKACDEVVILRRAGTPTEARAVANELAKEFGMSEKCDNKEGHAEEASFGAPATYVCLAVWYRERQSW